MDNTPDPHSKLFAQVVEHVTSGDLVSAQNLISGTASTDHKCAAAALALQLLPPNANCNPLHSLRLIRRKSDDHTFHGAIRRYETQRTKKQDEQEQPTEYSFCFPAAGGERKGGDQTHGVGSKPKTNSDKVLHSKTPKKYMPFNELDLSKLQEWRDNFEYEEILTKMAGLRGNDCYKVIGLEQSNIEATDLASTLSDVDHWPDELKKIFDRNSISKPTRLLNGWEPLEQQQNMNHNFAAVADVFRIDPFKWLYSLDSWLENQTVFCDVYRVRPASIEVSQNTNDPNARHKVTCKYVMLVSEEIAEQIKRSTEYRTHQQALRLEIDPSRTRYLCRVGNLLIAESDRMPKFEAGSNQFCRALVFGERSMVSGYCLEQKYEWYERINLPNKTVFTCWSCNDHLGCSASYGSKVLQVKDEETGKPVDCGRVAIDMLEG